MVRAPNHLGELVLALPALERAAARWSSPPLVQVVEELVPILEMSGLDLEPLPLRDRHALFREARALRRHAPDLGVLLTPSFSAALLFRMAGVRDRRGVRGDGRSWLLTDGVDRRPLLEGHRVREYLRLVEPEGATADDREGEAPPPPRLRELEAAREAWRALHRRLEIPSGSPSGRTVGLVPGGNAPARRWPAGRYARLVGEMVGAGHRVLVFGGPAEAERTTRVAAGAGGAGRAGTRSGSTGPAVDLGGRTSLHALAGGLETCDVVVSNDTGPMHVAAALGRPVVALEGPADVRQTRPLTPRVRLVGRFSLPCVPCVRNECPRSGPGYLREDARRECMRSIEVEEVARAVGELLGEEDVPGGDPGGEPAWRESDPGRAPGLRSGGTERGGRP